MTKRVHEDLGRTILLALAGFAALAVSLPDWAQEGVLLFALLYAVLIVVIDDDVRALFVRRRAAKAPVSRRAAT